MEKSVHIDLSYIGDLIIKVKVVHNYTLLYTYMMKRHLQNLELVMQSLWARKAMAPQSGGGGGGGLFLNIRIPLESTCTMNCSYI